MKIQGMRRSTRKPVTTNLTCMLIALLRTKWYVFVSKRISAMQFVTYVY